LHFFLSFFNSVNFPSSVEMFCIVLVLLCRHYACDKWAMALR
jgi:hypothetical protein